MTNIIILDTNIVSELTRPAPDPNVCQWAARQPTETLYLTAITEAELRYGIALLHPGRRRDSLEAAVLRMIEVCFPGRILTFNTHAAPIYAQIRAARRMMGRSINELDCMIAAIARANQAAVATRDTGGFAHCGIPLITPWQNPPPQPAQGSLTQ